MIAKSRLADKGSRRDIDAKPGTLAKDPPETFGVSNGSANIKGVRLSCHLVKEKTR